MPNAENIDKVIAAIAAEKVGETPFTFDMQNWWSDEEGCGTAACIGGTASALMFHEGVITIQNLNIVDVYDIADWLGLSWEGAYDMFYPNHCHQAFRATKEQAIEVLQRLKVGNGRDEWVAVMAQNEGGHDAQR